jgi:hypothetical protein
MEGKRVGWWAYGLPKHLVLHEAVVARPFFLHRRSSMSDESSGTRGNEPGNAPEEVKAAAKDAAATANQRKHAIAESLESVVTALRAAERALRDDNQAALAEYSAGLATYVERSTEYVRNNDMSGLMSDLERVGREDTGMFMGGTFVAGAALGRLLRASSPEMMSDGGAGRWSSTSARNEGAMSDGSGSAGATRTSPTDMMRGGMRDGASS